MSLRTLDPEKLKEKLKPFKISYIVEQSGQKFHRSTLTAWKNGRWKPSDDNLALLLSIIDCDFDEVSTLVEVKRH